MPEAVNLKVVPPETIERWRRQDRVLRHCETLACVIVRLAWWLTVFGAGYIAALAIQAGRGA